MRTFSVISSYRRQKQEKEKETENKDVAWHERTERQKRQKN